MASSLEKDIESTASSIRIQEKKAQNHERFMASVMAIRSYLTEQFSVESPDKTRLFVDARGGRAYQLMSFTRHADELVDVVITIGVPEQQYDDTVVIEYETFQRPRALGELPIKNHQYMLQPANNTIFCGTGFHLSDELKPLHTGYSDALDTIEATTQLLKTNVVPAKAEKVTE